MRRNELRAAIFKVKSKLKSTLKRDSLVYRHYLLNNNRPIIELLMIL